MTASVRGLRAAVRRPAAVAGLGVSVLLLGAWLLARDDGDPAVPETVATVVPPPFSRTATPASTPILPDTSPLGIAPATIEDGTPIVRGIPRLISYGWFEETPSTSVRGRAYLFEVAEDRFAVRLERLSGAEGRLGVYLSNEAHDLDGGALYLGLAPAGEAAQLAVPDGTDVSGFRSVVIWDESNATLAGVAPFLY